MESTERRLDVNFVLIHNNAVYRAVEYFNLDLRAFSEINRYHGKFLTHPKYFDNYSYHIFKQIAWDLLEHERRIGFTKTVGEEIYKKIEIMKNINPTGDPDDIDGWKTMLRKIGEYFVEVGYMTGFEFKFSGIFDKRKWKKQGEGNFIYTMKEPVIFESAKRLLQEEGFSQHTSSRTIQAGFRRYEIEGMETKDFDLSEFEAHSVDEVWDIRKIRA